MTAEPYTANMPFFKTSEERTTWIKDNAHYFKVVRFMGRGKYERKKFTSLSEAQTHARLRANETNRVYMVYAVHTPYDSWIENCHPAKNGGE